MDIQDILETKIKGLPQGTHTNGLRAVKAHIDAAIRHFSRGQSEPDEALFTDVIFRCNQAFEGSIKEAYRVLAGRDPARERPYDIEQFLSGSNLLRRKVLDQFTRYRQEWRNPAAHDYTLDFDEDEALLAIVTVTVFAIVLSDQIDGRLAFVASAAATSPEPITNLEENLSLAQLVAQRVLTFARSHVDPVGTTKSASHDYYRLEGALAGYLSSDLSTLPNITVEQNKRFSSREADIVVSRADEKIVIELKRVTARSSPRAVAAHGVTQAALYLHEPNVTAAVVLVYSLDERGYEISPASGALFDKVQVITPVRENARISAD